MAELVTVHRAALAADKTFNYNWSIVKDWSEEARYWPAVTEASARDLFDAVEHPDNGVLTWLKQHW